jgi:DNA-binding MarR family transcriptional regulator
MRRANRSLTAPRLRPWPPERGYIPFVQEVETAQLASELRTVLGQLMRRLRAENRLPIGQASVIARLDRDGPSWVSDLAAADRVRPQSMAQTVGELEAQGFVRRRPDPLDGRRMMVELTEDGRAVLEADRRLREGWLARAISHDLSMADQQALQEATAVLRRLAEL